MSLPTPQRSETADRPPTRFTWKIEKFSKLKTKKHYSEIFNVGGFEWRLLVFPSGNNTDLLAAYLDVADSETLPFEWSRFAQFSLAVIDQIDDKFTVRRSTQHRFHRQEKDWGFNNLILLKDLADPDRGYLVKDTIVVEADVSVPSPQDSKEDETSYVGLENEKANKGGREDESEQQSQNNSSGEVDISGTSPSHEQALQPILGTQTPSVDTSHLSSSEPTPASNPCAITPAARETNIVCFEGSAPAGKVPFLSYWVSSKASLLLERIHNLHRDTFTRFSMKGNTLQTLLLESFASFVNSMSTKRVNKANLQVLREAAILIKDFEQVGLEMSWLKRRLDEAKTVNKYSESLVFVDLCESALKVGRAKVRELEEGLAMAKAEVEVRSRDLPKSLGVDDCLLKDIV